ncbi:interaptin-like [Archocentrus centrarchus]|uniref:interaptin-like n=1 Tax=Archocentrus centrarchus TaxID=63155 RepID=UPI0011EA353E|nr:interaptin-like [Archocentrus centrarchus]
MSQDNNMSLHPRQSDYADPESFRRAFDSMKTENQDMQDIIQQMAEDYSQLKEKNREMEAQIKNLREISPQDQPGKDLQYKPDFKNLNEGWKIVLKRSQQQIGELQQVEAWTDQLADMFEKSGKKYESLQKKLDEALQINRELLKDKQQQEAKYREMERELQDLKAEHKEMQKKLPDLKEIHETKHKDQNLEKIHKETQNSLEEKNRDMEAQIKDLGEISQQDQTGDDPQYLHHLQILNEAWQTMFNSSKQQITTLLVKKKNTEQKLQDLKSIAKEKEEMDALADEMADLLKKSDKKIESLLSKLDQALQLNKEMLKEKQQQEAKHMETVCELRDIKVKHKATQQKLKYAEQKYEATQQKLNYVEQRYEEMQKKLQKSEKKTKGLQVTLDEALQRNAELQTEKEQQVEEIRQAKKVQDEKYEELKEKHSEKERRLEELQERCTKLKEENAHIVSEVHRLILKNKDLEEYRQKQMRKSFWFSNRGSAASPPQPGEK